MAETVNTAEIRVVADASGVEAGLRPAIDAAQRAERAISGIGTGSARSQQNLIQSIQRTTAEMEAGSRTGARYFEVLAQQRGIDPGVLQPYLQQLRAVEQAQQGAGQSAGQTANALRQVPAQLTDVITSLQGGMEPLTVLIQQGGQLRDSFGGIGPAARAMGSQVLAMVNPLTVAAAAVAVLTAAYYEGSQEADLYRNSLVMTGNAIGLSVGQVADMAQAIGKVSGTQRGAVEALVAMVDAGNISADRLQRFASVAIDLQDALGISVADTAQEFSDLGGNPVEAVEKLNDKYHFLTSAVYDQIRALENQGRTDEAAEVAQDAFAKAMEARTKTIVANLGYIESRWKELGEFASRAWDKMLGIGRADTSQDKLNGLLKEQARIEENIASARANKDAYGERKQQILLAQAQSQISAIRGVADAEKEKAKAQAAAIQTEEARIKWTSEGDKFLSKKVQLEREVAKARAEGAAAGASASEIEERIAKLREKYQEKGSGAAAKRAAAERKEEAQLLAELSGVTASYMEDLSRLNGQYAKGNLSQERYVELVTALISKQPGAKKMIDETAKEMADYAKSIASAEDALDKELASITKQIQATKDQNEQIGLSKSAIAELEAERLDSMANRLEENAITAEGLDLTGAKAESLRKEAAALRELAVAKRDGATRQAVADSAKQAADDWKKASETIEMSLTDALLRGFESGKGFGRNLVDTLRNMFNTLVLRPVISAIVNPVAGAVSGALGLAGTAQAATGGGAGVGSVVSGLGTLGSLTSGVGLLGAGGLGLQAGFGALMSSGFAGIGAAVSGGVAAIGAGTGASIAAGMGTIAGALGPIALGIGAAVAIWKKFDTSGTKHTGGAATSSSAGTSAIKAQSLNMADIATSAQAQKMVEGLTQGIVGILDSTALAFGKTAGYTAATAFADDTSKDGAWGSLMIQKLGQTVVNWQDTRGGTKWAPKTFADGEKGQEQYLAALTSSVRGALNSIGLPEWARTMLDSVASNASLENLAQVVEQINVTQAALGAMRSQLVGFSGMSDSAVSALMAAAGGIEKLFGSASAYYDAFYTEAEKNLTVNEQIAKQLAAVNLQMPATKEGFRALVEAQMKLGVQGAESVSVLLGVAGAFAELHPEVEAITKDLSAQRSALTDAYNSESDAIKSATDRMGSFAASLRNVGKNALLGGLSPLSPAAKYAEAKSQYEEVARAARGGDEKAQDRYQDVYTAFLEASRAVNASGAGYQQDFDYAQAMTEEMARWAGDQVDAGTAQLDALKLSVSGLIDVKKEVMSVRDAILLMHQAMGKDAPVAGARVASEVYMSAPVTYASYGADNTVALVAELKSVRQELASLRADQAAQTGHVIEANARAARENAERVAGATTTGFKSVTNSEQRVALA